MRKYLKFYPAYFIVCILLMMLEVYIAIYVHDQWIRPIVGDMLVVIVIYCLLRSFIHWKTKRLPIYVFLFAAFVEILQYFHLVEILGVEHITFLRILLGTTFDIADICAYAFGCICLLVWEYGELRKNDINTFSKEYLQSQVSH